MGTGWWGADSTVTDVRFIATAHNCVDGDWSSSLTKVGIVQWNSTCMNNSPTVVTEQMYDCVDGIPTDGYPSWLHTTAASLASQVLSHTVPHIPPEQYSTLPSLLFCPPICLTAVLVPLTSLRAPVELQDAKHLKGWSRYLSLNYTLTHLLWATDWEMSARGQW